MQYPQEDSMKKHPPFRQIIPCRGRVALAPTNEQSSVVTSDALDVVAPLTQRDRLLLRKYRTPPEDVQEHVAARIEAAHLIKLEEVWGGKAV